MALIDVVKYNGNNSEFVWKFPSEDLRLGTQLIVNHSQIAFFVKSGAIYDEFTEGRYTLKSGNIPLLNKLVNLPFGDKSPFSAEVWYVNLVSKLDSKWGTVNPINLEDPNYGIVVPVRAFGQYGFRIVEPKNFLKSIVGTLKSFSSQEITGYFNGKILSSVSTALAKIVIRDKISLLQIAAFQDSLSKHCGENISEEFSKYGIELVNFFFISINIPENDSSLKKLKEAKELAMKVNTVGKDIYQMERSFDVMDKAASNEGNAGGILSAGVGLGAGLGIGGAMGSQFSQAGGVLNTNPAPPPIPTQHVYYFVINGNQSEPYKIENIQRLISNNVITKETLAWRTGLDGWVSASEISEIFNIFNQSPPPIPR